MPIDVQAADIDLLAFPGHKSLLGPTGTGALYVGPRANLRPWREGGTGGDSSTRRSRRSSRTSSKAARRTCSASPVWSRASTSWKERGLDAIHEHEVELCDRLREALARLPGFEVFGHGDAAGRVGTVSFRCEVLPAAELGGILDQAFDIAVRPGLHCAPYIHKALGTFPDGLVRVSPGPFNTAADIDELIKALKEVNGGI